MPRRDSARLHRFLVVALLCLLPSFAWSGAPVHRARYFELPLSFEPLSKQPFVNRQFIARGPGYVLLVGATSARIALGVATDSAAIVEVSFLGANDQAHSDELDKQPGVSNYLRGNDPAGWRVGVPHFGRVLYADVYPGIDIAYYGNHSAVEHDFIVHPGADPRAIELKITNPTRLTLNASGDLVLRTGAGEIRLLRPRAYQETSGTRSEVAASYEIRPGNRVRIKLASYDRSRTLVVDPVLTYATYLGGTAGEIAASIAADGSGNAYITGLTFSTDFPIASAIQAQCKSCVNSPDVFISKLNATGDALVYSTYLGGSAYDQPFSIAVDGNGNAVVGGRTDSSDFPSVAPISTWKGSGGTHGFLASLKPDGSGLNYSTIIGGSNDDHVQAVSVDASGNAYLTGTTDSPDFPITAGTLPATPPTYPIWDIFVAKVSPAGSLLYSALIAWNNSNGYTSPPSARGIAIDNSGNAYITGRSYGGFPTTSGAFQTTFLPTSSSYMGFVAKLDPTASTLLYATYLGGLDSTEGMAIAVDSSGDALVTGTTGSLNFPTTTGAYQAALPTGVTCCSGFVTKMSSDGSGLIYSTYFAPPQNATIQPMSIAIGTDGAAYIAGVTNSTKFPIVNALQSTRISTGSSAFITALNPSGSALIFSTYLSGSTGSEADGIAMDGSANLYVAGTSYDTDFPVTSGAFQKTVPTPPQYVTPQHVFVARIASNTAGPLACFSKTSVSFGGVYINTTLDSSLTMTNCGGAVMNIGAVTAAAPFSVTSDCGATLDAGASCTVTVTFSPTAVGNFAGTLKVSDDAGASPQLIRLNASGVVAVMQMTNYSSTFSPQLVGVTSPFGLLAIKNTGGGTMTISNVAISGDFAIISNSCGAQLYGLASCAIRMTFTPTAVGVRTGTITIQDNASGSPHSANFSGTGVDTYPVPSITSISPQVMGAGGSASTLSITGSGFFPSSVIRFNGVDHSTNYSSFTNLSTTINPSDIPAMGEIPVTVFTPAPGGGESNITALTVYNSLPISAATLVFDPFTRQLFATLPANGRVSPNSVVSIDPATGNTGVPVTVGSDPQAMTISPDGRYLYMGLDGDQALRRFDITANTPGFSTALPAGDYPPVRVYSAKTVPGDSSSVVVSVLRSASPSESAVVLYKDGVLQSILPSEFAYNYIEIDDFAFTNDPNVFYAVPDYPAMLSTFSVTPSAITRTSTSSVQMTRYSLVSDGKYLYDSAGRVVDPSTMSLVGTYPLNSTPTYSTVPDSNTGRTYFLEFQSLVAFDQATKQQIGTLQFPQTFSNVGSLVRWGTDGFAFRMYDRNAYNNDHSKEQIIIFRTGLARLAATSNPAPILGSVQPATFAQGSGNVLVSVTGSGFARNSVVRWNGADRSTTYNSASSLLVAIPASDLASTGTASITVFNPLPDGGVSGPMSVVTGALGVASWSATSLHFDPVLVGAPSAALQATLTSAGAVPLAFGGFTVSGDFSESDTCPSMLSVAASCTVTVTFRPKALGTRTGSIVGLSGDQQGIALTGTGADLALSFVRVARPGRGVALSAPSLQKVQVSSAARATASLTCSGAPVGTTCVLSNDSLQVGGNRASTVSVQLRGKSGQAASGGVYPIRLIASAGPAVRIIEVPLSVAAEQQGEIPAVNNMKPDARRGKAAESTDKTTLELPTLVSSAPRVRLQATPENLDFAAERAAKQQVKLLNPSRLSVNNLKVEASEGFEQTNDCRSVLSSGDSCTLIVSPKPDAHGSGVLTITADQDSTKVTLRLK